MAARGWYVRITNGAYAASGGTLGRRLTTDAFFSANRIVAIEQQVTQLTVTFHVNVLTSYDWLGRGDLLEGEDIDPGDALALPPIPPFETHTPASDLVFAHKTSRFNPLQPGSRVELFWDDGDGNETVWSDIIVEHHEAVPGRPNMLSAMGYCQLHNYGQALPVGAGASSLDNLPPIVLSAARASFTDQQCYYSAGLSYSLFREHAFFGPPYTSDFFTDFPVTTADTITAYGTTSTETGAYGESYRYTDQITTSRLDAADNPGFPGQGFVDINGNLVFYNRYASDGTNWCFFECYHAQANTTENADTGVTFQVVEPKALAPARTVVSYTVPLDGSPASTTRYFDGAKVKPEPRWGGFILAEKTVNLEPIKASFAVFNQDGSHGAANDLDSDGKLTLADVFLAIATSPAAYGGMGLSTGQVVLPDLTYDFWVDYAAVSVALLQGEPAMEVINTLIRRAGLEQTLVVYHDADAGTLVFDVQGVDTGAADAVVVPYAIEAPQVGTIADAYTQMLGIGQELVEYNAVAASRSVLNTDSDIDELWLYLPHYTGPASDLTTDDGEKSNLPVATSTDGSSSNVRFQAYSRIKAATADVHERLIRHLTDERPDSYVQWVKLSTTYGSVATPFAACCFWFNSAADAEEIYEVAYNATVGRNGYLDVTVEGTNDPAFDPLDPRGTGIDVLAPSDLEWVELGGNLAIRARGEEPESVARQGAPQFLRAARAVRFVFKSYASPTDEQRFGFGDIRIVTRRVTTFLCKATDNAALRTDPHYLYAPGLYRQLYHARHRVGRIPLGAVGKANLRDLTRAALVASWRGVSTRSYTALFAGTPNQIAALHEHPTRPGQTLTITGVSPGDTRDLIVNRGELTLMGSLDPLQPVTQILHYDAFDPDEVF